MPWTERQEYHRSACRPRERDFVSITSMSERPDRHVSGPPWFQILGNEIRELDPMFIPARRSGGFA